MPKLEKLISYSDSGKPLCTALLVVLNRLRSASPTFSFYDHHLQGAVDDLYCSIVDIFFVTSFICGTVCLRLGMRERKTTSGQEM